MLSATEDSNSNIPAYDEEYEEQPPKRVTLGQASQCAKDLADFLTDTPEFKAEDELALRRIADRINRLQVIRTSTCTQTSIESFFSAA